ncbi:zinc-binding dehydrogenase [Planctomycetota bacterium]
MKAAVLTGLRQLELRDVPEPRIARDNDVLLKVEAVGVCGSDVHYYETGRIGSQIVEYPFIVGHECAATVVDVGKAVTKFKMGDSVVVDPAISCYSCDQCKTGREHTCRNLRFLGCPGQVSGCLCEYIVMLQQSCYPAGKKLTPEQGVICEPLSVGVYAVQQAQLQESQDIAILGAGPIGLSCLVAAKVEDVKSCFMTEKINERIEIAKKGGASWVGNPDKENIVKKILNLSPAGVDVVFECAGQQETIDQAVELLKPGGKFMLIGIPRTDSISLPVHKMRRKEITLINVRRQNKCTQSSVDLITGGKINIDFMITHRFKLEDTRQAFDLVSEYRDGVVKAIIRL